ncbi:hypothetical protein DEO72_LG9g1281 [Vigna unguiculata]|uniref:Uncharacterized protein n=1 Tax=Vigna unguiculata TaxID=3917 RepID=A0A4D6MXN5_VIGUN|nr:hypothetical protein DEO72_LG9g1281 [Vigna unguiculata]
MRQPMSELSPLSQNSNFYSSPFAKRETQLVIVPPEIDPSDHDHSSSATPLVQAARPPLSKQQQRNASSTLRSSGVHPPPVAAVRCIGASYNRRNSGGTSLTIECSGAGAKTVEVVPVHKVASWISQNSPDDDDLVVPRMV